MQMLAAVLIGVYGLAAIVGGLIGYFKAGSAASAAAGVPSGVLLLACAAGVYFQRPLPAFAGAIIVSLALAGFFGSKLVTHMDKLGEFVQSPAGPRTVAMFVGGLLVIIASAAALAVRPPA